MKELNFSYNWNNKLDCKAFTTLRLSDRFKIGDEIEVTLKGIKREGTFFVMEKKYLKLESISNFIAYLDTGYNSAECKKILQRMYSKKKVDWNTQIIHFYLIVKKSEKED